MNHMYDMCHIIPYVNIIHELPAAADFQISGCRRPRDVNGLNALFLGVGISFWGAPREGGACSIVLRLQRLYTCIHM